MLSYFKNIKFYLILVALIVASILGFKIIDLIRDTGLVKNKDEEIGELKVVKEKYKEQNKDLYKKIELLKKIEDENDKIIKTTITKDKEIIKHYDRIKKKVNKEIKQVKTMSKTVPKNINEPKIVINPYIYRESGKIMIDNIWNAYNDLKDKK